MPKRDFRTIGIINKSWLMCRNKVTKECLWSSEPIPSMVIWTLFRTPSILKEWFNPLNPCQILRTRRKAPWSRENPFSSLFSCKILVSKMIQFIQGTNSSRKLSNQKRKRSMNFKEFNTYYFFYFYYEFYF